MKYRKKPVVIEAFKWGTDPMPTWFVAADNVHYATEHEEPATGCSCYVKTLEGEMRADPGDWIIRGIRGELYPCKPEIFDATYEPAE